MHSLFALITGLALAATIRPAAADPMQAYAWQNRVLVLFAAEDDPRVEEQRANLRSVTAGLADRDLVAFAVVGGRIEPLHGRAPTDAAGLRERLDVDDAAPFTALLVGKDGGVKWREERPATTDELFALIDSMPMRRAESGD
ncbi:DUF4174 domain-containing protein [Marinivivus vitaminiproducens]|uniref:DUF4174 domain-containing protein n=1 Tax=Marinivivus vitaminiproducens TaxID=3035935 RepID=UPI00279F3DC6|nr:DUF4174 domain-containing protein [Geminicoccaceae bacterium SCSIO 64248]